MSVTIQRILSSREFLDLNNETMKQGMYNTDRRVFTPGTAWMMDWYFDPSGLKEKDKKHVIFKLKDRDAILSGNKPNHYLSMHYWRDWSYRRPPIAIVCPNNDIWEIDRLSANGGEGWKVTGEIPMISCSPSIDFPGYHGYLIRGMFSADINGRKYNEDLI